jgi:uncharacterized protein
MTAAFFHGLESQPWSEKNVILNKHFSRVYDPEMNYRNPQIFEVMHQCILEVKPDVLIGSSMGGWFAHCISTLTGIPTLLFNPAFVNRSFNPTVILGKETPLQTAIFGRHDLVIDPKTSVEWLMNNFAGPISFSFDDMEHRIPAEIFEYWIVNFIKKTNI